MSTASSLQFRSIAVVGAGAVGSFYGAMLAAAGHAVTLIGRPAHMQAIRQAGLALEMGGQIRTVAIKAAETGLQSLTGADLVLCCVKSTDTLAVAREMAAHIPSSATVLSLQNGLENAACLAGEMHNPVVPAVVYVGTTLPSPGRVRHLGRGDLVIGPREGPAALDATMQARLQGLADLFSSAGIAVRIDANVMTELWSKLMINCAFNALSAIGQANYASIAASAQLARVQEDLVREVIAVAHAEGVSLSLADSLAAVAQIARTMPGQLSSTAQDVARARPTEIDHLNGFIARRGAAHGVPVPVNRTVHALVKLLEAGYARSPAA